VTMEGLNRVTLIGNIGADPELRTLSNGSAKLGIRLAVTEAYFDRNKQRQERTEWVSVVLWDRRAEGLGKILQKGEAICVEGRLSTREYEDREGNKRRLTEVTATNVVLLSQRPRRDTERPAAEDQGSLFGD